MKEKNKPSELLKYFDIVPYPHHIMNEGRCSKCAANVDDNLSPLCGSNYHNYCPCTMNETLIRKVNPLNSDTVELAEAESKEKVLKDFASYWNNKMKSTFNAYQPIEQKFIKEYLKTK